MEVECTDIAFVFLFWPREARAAAYCNTITFIWLPWQLTDKRRYRSDWTIQRKHLPLLEDKQLSSIVCSLISPPHLNFSPPLSFPLSSHSLLSLLIVHCPSSVSFATLGCFSIATSISLWEMVLVHRPFSDTPTTPGCLPIATGSLMHHLHLQIITRSKRQEIKAVYWNLLHP